MVYYVGEIAQNVYDSDKVIKETIENIVEKEKKIMKDYANLKNFRNNAPKEFIDDLDNLLEERKLFLNYKLQSKEKQVESLIKLLEYINTLDKKFKQYDSDKLLSKVETLENEIMQIRDIF
tara:strand:- start:83 stop:445 length:363 start_codon:yes stop_codon:yes gene_type:complete